MALLACQFGLQPLFTKENVAPDADKVPLVLLCEVLKCVLALCALSLEKNASTTLSTWSLTDSVVSGAVPAAMYAVQNVFIQIGYQHTTGLMFNLLNQTKIIFTAVCVYFVVGKRQSSMQMVALAMVLGVGIVLSLPPSKDSSPSTNNADKVDMIDTTTFDLWYGVLPTLIAAFLSGIASAWSQKVMQGKKRRSASMFSAELSFFSSMFLFGKMLSVTGNVGDVIARIQTLVAQNPNIWIPLCTNAVGGLFVGQVIKHAGGVRKSFSVMAGIIMTGAAEWFMFSTPLSVRMLFCLPIAIASMYLYATYPYVCIPVMKPGKKD